MFCTDKERDNCNVEKMGCEGCYYNTDKEEKTAYEMFEELGYKKIEENDKSILYLSEKTFGRERRIRFWKDDKGIFNDLLEDDKVISSVQIGMQELQAINKKRKELNWLGDE
jgi:hypothetical protein